MEAEALRLQGNDDYLQALQKNLGHLDRLRTALGDGFERLPFALRRDLLLEFVAGLSVRDRNRLVVNLKVAIDDHGISHLADEVIALENGEWKPRNEDGLDESSSPLSGAPGFCQPGPVRYPRHESNVRPTD